MAAGRGMAMNEIKKAATQSARDQQAYFNKGFESVIDEIRNKVGDSMSGSYEGKTNVNVFVELDLQSVVRKVVHEIDGMEQEKRLTRRR